MTASHVPDDFDQIIADNYQRIYGVILRFIGDQHEAEDLTQDTFINAFRARNGFRGDSQTYTWLYRIAINLAKNRLEQLKRRAYTSEAEQTSSEETWEESLEAPTAPPDEMVEKAELERVVGEAVLRLRPEYREVIILRDYEGLSYEEITQALGCSLQTVKSRLFRARGRLRQRLARYLEE
ncbi:MAG: sigma-70 family RNA polymerase sigma factor [candidate division WS1 bacterium]|jgi:RNA polymerase sigma-70 factor (ECF subfamily)|nr:sigma-70 family RNA polymerase sigma factor [candidate division WS1 bacterium]